MSSKFVRKPYQGVVQILHFNWPSYLGAAMGIGVAILALPFLHPIWRVSLLFAVAPAAFWLASSLIVSHYVYDRFPLYDLNWIARVLPRAPKKWVNIHCGFDETSDLLATIFPEADSRVIDIYDPRVMTEGSIRMAQRMRQSAIPCVVEQYHALACSADSFDAAFLIFAAHELRRHDQRVTLFREIARILVPDGDLILMEHSRDFWNFVAFGPGFLHFFSQYAWRKAAFEAGLTLRTELSMTPFVHVYHLRKAT
jgi:SAM-dependent methyltransferase